MYKLSFLHILNLYMNKKIEFPVVNNRMFQSKTKYFHVHCVNFFSTKIEKYFAWERHTVSILSIAMKARTHVLRLGILPSNIVGGNIIAACTQYAPEQ